MGYKSNALSTRPQLYTLKFHHLNSESAIARAQLTLKGSGRLDYDWFIACYDQKTPITHKRIGSTHLDHVHERTNRFPDVKLAKVDSDTLWVHLRCVFKIMRLYR